MVTMSPEYQKAWRAKNPGKMAEYNTKRTGKKRCPSCNKEIKIRVDLVKFYPDKWCTKCRCKVHASRTLSANPNSDNVHGVRLAVI